jgi:hypothetical protein
MKKIYLLIIFLSTLNLISCTKEGINSAMLSGKAGSLARFALVGNHLYALDGDEIVSYNISKGASPVFAGRVKVDFDIETIYGYNDNLFIGAETAMYVYSLENPAKPKMLSIVRHVRSCDPVVVQGNYAYVTLRSGTGCGGTNVLNVYNVTNLSAPVLLNSISINSPFGLGVNDNALYVTYDNGIKVFNIADPANPVFLIDIIEPTATDVIPYTYNNTLLVQLSKGTALYDISSSLNPTFITRINL